MAVTAILLNLGIFYYSESPLFASFGSFGGPEESRFLPPPPAFLNGAAEPAVGDGGLSLPSPTVSLVDESSFFGVGGPVGKSSQPASLVKGGKLPNLAGYFALPATGWNWGRIHDFNAVDIAAPCGTPVYAAAEGLVIEERASGWNNGYGSYLKIEHPNGAATLYSHTGGNEVSIGNYVLRGDLIAYVGNTGNTHGPTGCHLHFEVYGAKNPFAK